MKDKTYVFPVEKARPLEDLVGIIPDDITIKTPTSGFQLLRDAVIQKLHDAIEFTTLYKPSRSGGCHEVCSTENHKTFWDLKNAYV